MQVTWKTEEENPESPAVCHHAYQDKPEALYLINSRAGLKPVMAKLHVCSLCPNHDNDLEVLTGPRLTSSCVYDLLNINIFSLWNRQEFSQLFQLLLVSFGAWGYKVEKCNVLWGINLNVQASDCCEQEKFCDEVLPWCFHSSEHASVCQIYANRAHVQ